MRGRILLLVFIIFFIDHWFPAHSQLIDTIKAGGLTQDAGRKPQEINLSHDQALIFLQKYCRPFLWHDLRDPLRSALERLIFEASNPPADSAIYFLRSYPYDSLSIPTEPAKNTISADSAAVKPLIQDNAYIPAVRDTTAMVFVDTLPAVSSSDDKFPFRYFKYPYRNDSIKVAVNVLADYLQARDSSVLNVTGIKGKNSTMWLNSKSDRMIRYWLKNDLNDSVTVWIGSPDRNTIGLYMEHGVSFRRPAMQGNVSGARVNVEKVDKSKLLNVSKIITKTQYWRYRTESAFSLNQGLLSNWVKGGESSISTTLDLTAYFDYSNKPMLISSNHFARLKFGMLATNKDRDWKIMKNLDLLETNSKFNHKAFGKFDFSAIMLFKTQIARGYSDPDDSVAVSKFMNPATLTLGFGLDYKPDKLTSINFSPFSYKATFVPDTSSIDQTKYGIAANRRSKHEPGASIMISNEFRPVKSVVVTNRLQLFTNYINNPLNIDVDWEMILVANLNWFTDVRLNTHLIFDDDTKTPVIDKKDQPVLGQDGLQKKTARVQFKELLGLSFVFRF